VSCCKGRLIREALGGMLGGEPLQEVLVAGNTAMHHLFCGLDVEAVVPRSIRLTRTGRLPLR